MKKEKTVKLIALLLAVLMSLALCACGAENGGNKDGRPTAYDGKNEFEALLDYADRLEEAGNAEAAALVRSKIPQAAAGEARQKAYEKQEENSDLQWVEDLKDLTEFYNLTKGGKR